MLNAAHIHLQKKLDQRDAQGNRRQLRLLAGTDFFSNDYLGIATTGILKELLHRNSAYGATGSRLLSGNNATAENLETFLAAFHKTEAALVFNSGYDANLGLFSSIPDRHCTVLYDEYCHASIIDGIRLSQAKNKFYFKHNNLSELEQLLQKHTPAGPVFIAVESLYSMEGDVAPLEELAAIAAQYGAALIVDEAHATGIAGDKGAGLVQHLGLQDKVFARVHTFGKALGCHGAVVAGSQMLKDYLVNFARSFIFTTALPPAALETVQQAYLWMQNKDDVRKSLQELIAYFNGKKQSYENAYWLESNSPIQSIITGSNTSAKALAANLRERGFNIAAILHPTVPEGTERIRICLHAFNTREETDRLHHYIHLYLCQQQ
ncbi:aminotransferase class I/II-fold pyridoxal phosphate-dependent enzyme [Chitinophagaceae bacterium MMS25-I14]